MKKYHSFDKDRMRTLCANVLLYVFPPEGGYFRPTAIRFKRNGEVWGYRSGKGWQNMAGATGEGPRSFDRWNF